VDVFRTVSQKRRARVFHALWLAFSLAYLKRKS
jgi:hypothetical protein